MASRRMISRDFMNSNEFSQLSNDAKILYVYMNVEADDDGFINGITNIQKILDLSNDTIHELINNNLIIRFQSGVILLVHWQCNNTIQNDRYHKTRFQDEKSRVELNENNIFCLKSENVCDSNIINSGSELDPETRIDKSSLVKGSIDKHREEERSLEERGNQEGIDVEFHSKKLKESYGIKKLVKLTKEEYLKLNENNRDRCIEFLSEKISNKNYTSNNHFNDLDTWVPEVLKREN